MKTDPPKIGDCIDLSAYFAFSATGPLVVSSPWFRFLALREAEQKKKEIPMRYGDGERLWAVLRGTLLVRHLPDEHFYRLGDGVKEALAKAESECLRFAAEQNAEAVGSMNS